VSDFESIARMPSVEYLFILDDSVPDLSPLRAAPKLRNVALPNVQDAGSLPDILPNVRFQLRPGPFTRPRVVAEAGADQVRYVHSWNL
jgi:hypothetical protein